MEGVNFDNICPNNHLTDGGGRPCWKCVLENMRARKPLTRECYNCREMYVPDELTPDLCHKCIEGIRRCSCCPLQYSPRLKKKFAFHVYIYTAIYSFPPSLYIRFYRFNKGWFEGVCEKCSRMLFSMRKEFLNVDVYEIIEKRVQSHYFRSYFRAHYERNPHYYDSVLMHV